jgi:hypothetical protein
LYHDLYFPIYLKGNNLITSAIVTEREGGRERERERERERGKGGSTKI